MCLCMQGIKKKKNEEAKVDVGEVRSSGRSEEFQGRALRRMGQCGCGQPNSPPYHVSALGGRSSRIAFTSVALCDVVWYLISVPRMLHPRGLLLMMLACGLLSVKAPLRLPLIKRKSQKNIK